MMICKADFEDLFPHLFQPQPAPVPARAAKPQALACIARWENEGGRTGPVPQDRSPPDQAPASRSDASTPPAGAGKGFSTMPAAAAYAAAWAMLATYDRMKRWNPALAGIGRH